MQKHGGAYSAQLGASSDSEPNGDSSLYRTITIPSTATKATLTFWYWPSTTDTITYDWQEAQVQNSSGATLAQIMKVASNTQVWTQVTYDLTTYKGQAIGVHFNHHQDGYGDLTYMYLDDVSLTVQWRCGCAQGRRSLMRRLFFARVSLGFAVGLSHHAGVA